MTVRQLGRRDPCHCGSGKRYKNCHGKTEKIAPVVMNGDDGFSAMLHLDGMKGSLVEEEQSRIPEWLFLHAANYAEDSREGGGNAATLMTVLLTGTASEALVNRLLGPLVPQEEWDSMERKGAITKWKALGKQLGLERELSPDRRPLQDLAAVHDLRNEMAHFKHERHSTSVTRPLLKTVTANRVVFDGATAGPPIETRGTGPNLYKALAQERGPEYFDALLRTLELALGSYQEDRFHIVERLREVIAQARAGRA